MGARKFSLALNGQVSSYRFLPGSVDMAEIHAMAVDSLYCYFWSTSVGLVKIRKSDGAKVAQFNSVVNGVNLAVHDLAVSADYVFAADDNNRVVVFSKSDLSFFAQLGSVGVNAPSGPYLNKPMALSVDNTTLYVADTGNFRINKYQLTSPFNLMGSYDQCGVNWKTIVGLAVDAIKNASRVDAVIIASGDGDFVPLVEYLKTKTQVECISFGRSTSQKLRECVDDFIDMSENPKRFTLGASR
jgi:hypothetical protein